MTGHIDLASQESLQCFQNFIAVSLTWKYEGNKRNQDGEIRKGVELGTDLVLGTL